MVQELVTAFVSLWVVVDPIGTVPVFVSFTRGMTPERARRTARRAILVALGILLFFLVAGQILLGAMGIPLASFQVAGGIVLFLFALTMIFGPSKPDAEIELAPEDQQDVAIYPLAVPSIASPGAMLAIVMLTDNSRYRVGEQALVALVLVMVLAATLLLLMAAPRIQRLIGNAGASIVSRVMGLVLASVAVDAVLEGLRESF